MKIYWLEFFMGIFLLGIGVSLIIYSLLLNYQGIGLGNFFEAVGLAIMITLGCFVFYFGIALVYTAVDKNEVGK